MNELVKLTNTEKAKLLHSLFPNEISSLLENIQMVCANIQENKVEYARDWKNGFMPFDYWLSLSQQTSEILKKHTLNMSKSSRVFSDQLFFTYTALFVVDRIVKYAENVNKNEKFKLAVNLLFNP